MLSTTDKLAFLLFALVTVSLGLHGFYRLGRRIRRGAEDTDLRLNELPRRIVYAATTTLSQSRTFRNRPWVSFFHSFIFYGFVYYLVVNLVDAAEGFVRLSISSTSIPGKLYNVTADLLSALVLRGGVALVARRFLLPSRRDFTFNERTLLHESLQRRAVTRDSIVVSAFILFHVGSRALGSGAKILAEGPDRWQPFAMGIAHYLPSTHAEGLRVFGYWGALGSVLAFLVYFPRSKHIHIFMAPFKYVVSRDASSGVLPPVKLDAEADEPKLGAKLLEDLAWPRLVDAYACVQCNRCQDVCPATATGKSLSPSALEINKRMELNRLGRIGSDFEQGKPSPNPLLSFALSPEAAWACTTCGACMQACPVQDEPMLDIIDVRRQQVMMEGEFPAQLQTAFRGMERSQNPWGINHAKRLDWADGLRVKTTEENPKPDVLYWVGCAASYDPQSQKTARAFVQLLDHAKVDFAVLGKRECCTGDTARRAGNEYLYRQLADTNVATLNEVKPKLIVASCPHCMNTVGKEYKQLGGDYKVIHHTEYLQGLVAKGLIQAEADDAAVAYHDPCYLGRHNGVYDAPRNLLNIISNGVVELDRTRENAFCCGAGGAQFWKEEEQGSQRVSDNRYLEAKAKLNGASEKVLAVGCPFCKSMLQSTPSKGDDDIAVRDVAELLWERVQRKSGRTPVSRAAETDVQSQAPARETVEPDAIQIPASYDAVPADVSATATPVEAPSVDAPPVEQVPTIRKKWTAKDASAAMPALPGPPADLCAEPVPVHEPPVEPRPVERKKWNLKTASVMPTAPTLSDLDVVPQNSESPVIAEQRKKWPGKSAVSTQNTVSSAEAAPSSTPAERATVEQAGTFDDAARGDGSSPETTTSLNEPVAKRKTWTPKK